MAYLLIMFIRLLYCTFKYHSHREVTCYKARYLTCLEVHTLHHIGPMNINCWHNNLYLLYALCCGRGDSWRQ